MRPLFQTAFSAENSRGYDCWNKIGVYGDKSCPELARHSHCRNCPVFSAAAALLLDRDVPAESAADWVDHFAESRPIGERKTNSAIMFRLGTEWFALSTLVVDEIIGLRAIHSLPHWRNPVVLGLVNVRGELVICMSVARLLTGDAASQPQGRLVVARHANGRLAFPVDEVQHAHRYHPHELQPVPTTLAKSASSFTRGLLPWRDRMAGCLDEQLLIQALTRNLTS